MMPPVSKVSKSKPKPSTLDFGSKTKVPRSRSRPLSETPQPYSTPPPNSAAKSKGKCKEYYNDALWVDLYAPSSLDELAVHKRKVEEVSHWLSEAVGENGPETVRKYRRILALTGPAGSGKTTTLKALASSMNISVVEWRNSMNDVPSFEAGTSNDTLADKFSQFLTRTAFYSGMDVSIDPKPSFTRKRLVLIEDFPNVLHEGTRNWFHQALDEFLAVPVTLACPLVFVVSDSGARGESTETEDNSWRNRSRENLDIRTLIPKELLESAYFTNISFNPIAMTYMRKALSTLMDKLSKDSETSSNSPKDIIEKVIQRSNGDIRSAVMTLQFSALLRPEVGRKKAERARREKEVASLLEAVTQRDDVLELFHLLGKILYNKRYGDDPTEDKAPKTELPVHLREHDRALSKVDANMLFSDSPVDTSLMTLYLHQNYTQFCADVEHADAICGVLSVGDEWENCFDSWGSRSSLSEHRFHLISRGTLHGLPSPVSRRDQKVVKPRFFDIQSKARNAGEQLQSVASWLNDSCLSVGNGALWKPQYVSVELSEALLRLVVRGPGTPDHSLLRLNSGFNEFCHSSVAREKLHNCPDPHYELEVENEIDVRVPDSEVHQRNVTPTGWLENDEIEDDVGR